MAPSVYNYPVHAVELCIWLHRFVYVCPSVCLYGQKQLFRVLTLEISHISVIYCTFVEYNHQKRGSLTGDLFIGSIYY